MECPPPLELLPRELIWSLIEQAPEAVAALRLVCYYLLFYYSMILKFTKYLYAVVIFWTIFFWIILPYLKSSSTLRAHVDQYALHGAAIRLVDEVQVNSLGLQACVDVKVEVPRRMASLLELRLRLRCAQAKRILKRRRIDDRIVSFSLSILFGNL